MADKNVEDLRKKLLKKLSGVEMMLGCTAEELLQVLAVEISARLPQGQTAAVNVDEIIDRVMKALPDPKLMAERITVAVETKMAGKLDEIAALIKQSPVGVDVQGVITGVAELLKPELSQAAQTAAETVFLSNRQSLMKSIEDKFQQLTAAAQETAAANKESAQPNRPAGGGSMVGGLLQMAMSNPEGLKGMAEALKGILDVFRPAQPVGAALGGELQKLLQFHDLMTKIEKRQASSEEIVKGLSSVTGSTPASG